MENNATTPIKEPTQDRHLGRALRLDDDVWNVWHKRRKELEVTLRLLATKGVTPDKVARLCQDMRDAHILLQACPESDITGAISYKGILRYLKALAKFLCLK